MACNCTNIKPCTPCGPCSGLGGMSNFGRNEKVNEFQLFGSVNSTLFHFSIELHRQWTISKMFACRNAVSG